MSYRILIIRQWFEPEQSFKGLVFARELIKLGFNVEVITGFPNYPGGKIYPGYKIKLIQRELIDGVQITRVPLYPSHDQSIIGRILNYLSFAVSALIYGLFMAKRANVMYAYHPPLTVGITATIIHLLRRIPLVYDIQDMWPDTLRATGMLQREYLLSIIERMCNWVYKRADHLVVLSPGFKKLLVKRGVPSKKISTIYNWADEASLRFPQGKLPNNFPSKEGFTVVFAGNMGKAQALDTVIDAAILLKQQQQSVCFILIGGGVELSRLKQRCVNLKLHNVLFFDSMPMNQIGSVLQQADVLLVNLCKDPLFTITIPSKTQAYMAAGKPIIMSVGGDAADMIKNAECGIIVEPENPTALADAVSHMAMLDKNILHSMGKKARTYYENHLALNVGVQQFAKLFNSISL